MERAARYVRGFPEELRQSAFQLAYRRDSKRPGKKQLRENVFYHGTLPMVHSRITEEPQVIAWILGQAVWTGRDERRCGVSAENEEKEKVRGAIRVTKRQGIPLENGQASLETCRRWIRALPLPRKLMDLKRVLSEGSRGTVVLQRI